MPSSAQDRTGQGRKRMAWGLPLVWLCIALAGADHPPPLGFAWLLPALCAVGGVVYWRWPRYAEWKSRAVPWRWARVASEGAAAGGMLAAVFALPRWLALQVSAVDGAVWLLAGMVLGLCHAVVVYVAVPTVREEES